MAPKRAAKKAAPPPPPPPPAESSDETRSGSRSRSEESEDEEAIAESPVPAATPAPKTTPAPAQNGDASESSGEEDDEEEEEEEEEEEKDDQPARAAPKNQTPPPQEKEDSDASGSDEDDEEEEERTLPAPPSVPKKQPPQPQKEQDSDTSGSDDDEEEEAPPPPPKPAANKDTAALKPPAPAAAADEAKKPGGIQRIWSTDDELRILEALAAYQKQHGAFPQPEALIDSLAGKLDNPAYGSKELMSKVKTLKHRYVILSKKGEVPSKEHDRRLLDLSKIVWEGSEKTTTAVAVSNNHGEKGFEEMCELYPYLAEEVKELEAARPGMCKRVFGKMDHDKAGAMDEKIKKQRVVQIRVEMRRGDLAKEVTKALVDLVDG